MTVKNFSLQDLTKRIMINLPSRFTKEEGTNVYKFFETIAEAFSIDTDKVDELITQTNLDTATGAYLDRYISGLAGFGRLNSAYQSTLETEDEFEIICEDNQDLFLPDYNEGIIEDDQQYRDRYRSTLYTYNSTKSGIRQIIVDFTYESPSDMYAGSRRGSHYSDNNLHVKNYFNDQVTGRYGSGGETAFIGYIELSYRPSSEILNILCAHLDAARASGIKLYLKYPLESLQYNFIDSVICKGEQIAENKRLEDDYSVTAVENLNVILLLPNAAVVGTAIVGVSFVG